MTSERPTTLLAELTHRCPLHCPYCSNPLDLIRAEKEMSTGDWKRVITEARALGVLQLGLSGGEPLVARQGELRGPRRNVAFLIAEHEHDVELLVRATRPATDHLWSGTGRRRRRLIRPATNQRGAQRGS